MLKGKPFELGDVIRAPKMSQNRGGSGIFLGGNISCIRKPQVISGGGGEEEGVRTPAPSPKFRPCKTKLAESLSFL